MKIIQYTESEEARKDFYPTPPEVLEVLLSDMKKSTKNYSDILEPSAGTGNIIEEIMKHHYSKSQAMRDVKFYGEAIRIDCVEIDNNLRGIIKHKFEGETQKKEKEKVKKLQDEKNNARKKEDETLDDYFLRQEDYEQEINKLRMEYEKYNAVDVSIIHDDFITLQTEKIYDLIVMNPPFSTGVDHVLKAIEMQERCGGEVWAVLNSNSLTNAYSKKREFLLEKIEEYEGEVQHISNGFSNSERETDVTVAIIKIKIPDKKSTFNSNIYDTMKKSKEYEIDEDFDENSELAVNNFVKSVVLQYDLEIKSGIQLIKEFTGYRNSIKRDDSNFSSCLLSLSINYGKHNSTIKEEINNYISGVRNKYWTALFTSEKFIGRMPTKVQQEYRSRISSLKDYDFTEFNINKLAMEMAEGFQVNVQDTIVELFDKMTYTHAYHGSVENKNKHYFNGWKTNKVYKVGKRVVLPVNAFSYWSRGDYSFDYRKASDTLEDLERTFNYLSGYNEIVNLRDKFEELAKNNITKNIQLKYFTVTFYKKGTMHITFTDLELLDRFNIYCCGKKNWLPPEYGKKQYKDMTDEEKQVVKEFHSDTTKEKDIEEKYNEIVSNSSYYLSDPTKKESSNIKLLN